MNQQSVTYRYKEHTFVKNHLECELDWISAASKAFSYCGHLLQLLKKHKAKLTKLQEEIASLKSQVERQKKFIDDLTGKDGRYDTVC